MFSVKGILLSVSLCSIPIKYSNLNISVYIQLTWQIVTYTEVIYTVCIYKTFYGNNILAIFFQYLLNVKDACGLRQKCLSRFNII